jgi:hypothetical protein
MLEKDYSSMCLLRLLIFLLKKYIHKEEEEKEEKEREVKRVLK